MVECPIWRWPLPTKYTFIHFEEDLWHKAWLNRSVSCPDDFVPVSRVLEQEYSPAVASAAVPRTAPREGVCRTSPPARRIPSAPEESQASAWGSQAHRQAPTAPIRAAVSKAAVAKAVPSGGSQQVPVAPNASSQARVLHATSKKAASKPVAPALVEVRAPTVVEAPERSAERTTSSDDDGGEWQIARSSRSAHRNREAALLSKVDTIDSAKERSKWTNRQKGSAVDLWAPVEEEDARTDATGSTGPGGEEVTSGGSAASGEQTRNGTQDRDTEVDDTSPDDGWTQVPARKKEKKELSRTRAVVDPVSTASVPKSDAWANRHEGAWNRPLQPTEIANRASNSGIRVGGSTAKDAPKDVETAREAKGTSASDDTPKGDVVVAEEEAADRQAAVVGPPSTFSRSGAYSERRYAGGRSWGGRSEAAYNKRGEQLVNYEVGIKQEEDFNLMRRLLVPGGGQIRRIAHLTGAKLTVRGEGTGHLEGPENKEVSEEPLMICICSAYPDNLAGARREVEELILKLHEDYRAFCRERGIPVPELKISPGAIAS